MSVTPEILAWMDAKAPTFEFASSLRDQFNRRGFLSERQIAAAQKCIAAWNAAKDREANAVQASCPDIENAFARAKESGLKRPRLTFASVKFSPAAETSANPGAIYAKDCDGVYLGKFAAGRFVRSRDCTDEHEREVLRIAMDPYKAAVEHGKLTGGCCVCNRTLSDPESVALGIGPVCAKKFGWQ